MSSGALLLILKAFLSLADKGCMRTPVRFLLSYSLIPAFLACLSLLALASCKEKPQAPMLPSEGLFQWGQDPLHTAERFAKAGWQKKLRIDDQIELVVPADRETREAFAAGMGTEMPENYTMTLYGQKGRLVIAKIRKRDTIQKLGKWLENIKAAFHLKSPVWKSKSLTERTESGAEIHDRAEIYDTGDLFVVLEISRSDIRDNLKVGGSDVRLKDGANMEAELRLYHKQENEGLSGEALIRQVQSSYE